MHLVSRVVGQLRHDLDALHAYQACMNMGTLTGAPKVRAMQLIRQVEKARRGSYGGAVGYLTGEGNFDTCIVIRSAYIENGIAHVQAGAGVVFDSDPQRKLTKLVVKHRLFCNSSSTQGEHLWLASFLSITSILSYNLVDQFRSLGHEVTIYRNTISIEIKRTVIELENAVFVLSLARGSSNAV